MINKYILNGQLKYSLNERLHVWKHFSDEFDAYKEHMDALYVYIRRHIIHKLNTQTYNNIVEFNIPQKYTHTHDRTLKPLKIKYINTQQQNVLMKTYKPDNNCVCIDIHQNIFNKSFKTTLMHELKHWVQLSLETNAFNDYYKHILIENPQYHISNFIKQLILTVDKLNPVENTAYMEQVYTEAYFKLYDIITLSNTDNSIIHSTIEDILQHFKLDEKSFSNLIQKCNQLTYNKEFQDYIATLYVINLHCFDNVSTYKLFHRRFLKHPVIQHINHSFVYVDKSNVSDFIEESATKIINDNELIESLIKNFILKLQSHRNDFVYNCGTVVYTAIEDLKDNLKHNFPKKNDHMFYDYIRIFNNEIYIEVVAKDDITRKERIFELHGKKIDDVFRKFNTLEEYIDVNEIDVDFNYGFANIFYNISSTFDSLYIDEKKIPKYNSFKDFEKLIDYINSL